MHPDNDAGGGPVQDQHDQPDSAKIAGILAQQEADLAGHDEAEVLDALRQRLTDTNQRINEDTLLEHAHRIAGLKPTKFSKE